MPKRGLGIPVDQAARERVAWAFDRFERLYVSFSGGKDSTALLHLVMDEARRRARRVGVLFIDWECQITLTIDFVREMMEAYADLIEPYWFSVPMKTWNSCSQYEPEWTAWDRAKEPLWVRRPDALSITYPFEIFHDFPFYYEGMPFEEFVPAFAEWYSQGKLTGCFVGIRADESLNRFRSIARSDKPRLDGRPWTTEAAPGAWNVYPIYDWRVEDVWTYFARGSLPYNKLYDLMYQAGVGIHQMRICEPFGDEARKGLWLYQVVEPTMWAKVSLRVAGANTGQLYARERGAVMGNHMIALPEGHNYHSFALYLLDTMPPATARHYRNKVAIYLKWWSVRGYPDGIPDRSEVRLESAGKAPTWRKVCKTFLKNDYWCKGLGFSPTKAHAYAHYTELVAKKRQEWGLMADPPAKVMDMLADG